MPTSLTMALFVLGSVFLLLALVGGKFKLFGAEVAGVAVGWARWLAGFLGIGFVGCAVLLSVPQPKETGTEPNESVSRSTAHPVQSSSPGSTSLQGSASHPAQEVREVPNRLPAASKPATAHYPEETRQNFLISCTQGGSSQASCECMLSELENRYTHEEFAAMDIQARMGTPLPQEFYRSMAAAKIHCDSP